MDPRSIVRSGYDRVARSYLEWHADPDPTTGWFLDVIASAIPSGSLVLDLGCGAGVPVARRLVGGNNRVVGVDLSGEQLGLARRLVPEMTLVRSDLGSVAIRPASFDAVVMLYAIVHVPRAEQSPLLGRIASWLKPGGRLFANFGVRGADDEIQEDWLGVPMFFASFDAATNTALLEGAGFTVELDEVRAVDEGVDEIVEFQWVVARRPSW